MKQIYTNLDIIVIEDCSIDGSLIQARCFSKKDEIIRLIEHKCNLGLSEARNTGLKHAVGDYLYFLDSDDVINPKKFDLLVESMKGDEGIISMSNFRFVDGFMFEDCGLTSLREVNEILLLSIRYNGLR